MTESILENPKNLKPVGNRVESLKTLTERLLHERESLKRNNLEGQNINLGLLNSNYSL
jgi:hypothetical protein